MEESDQVKLTKRGCDGIVNANTERQDDVTCKPGDVVHRTCRRDFTDKRRILLAKRKSTTNVDENVAVELRSTVSFNFRDHCLFCAKPAKLNKSKRGLDVNPVRTMDFQTTILKICSDRDDVWGNKVQGRINSVNDLHAADAIYHQMCNVNFRTKKQIPILYSSEETPVKRKRLSGRPAEEVRKVAFEKTMKFFEQNDDEQITIGKLVTEMSKYCGEPYSVVYMRQMLKARYGDNIIVTSINGKTDVVTFRYTARYILHEFFEDSKSKCDDDKDGIIKAAANIIRSDIKSLAVSKQVYPPGI